MRKNLLIFSHNDHAFLASDIPMAAKVFEQVYVICPTSYNILSVLENIPNVKVLKFSKFEMYKQCLKHIFNIFIKEKQEELRDARQAHKLNKLYFKSFMLYLSLEYVLKDNIKKLQINEQTASEWIILSAWYAGTANAAAKIKQMYPQIRATSFAHSFEVDPLKNNFNELLYRKTYHNLLDKVYFISQNVYEHFRNSVAQDLNLDLGNCVVEHLGTIKRCEGCSTPSDNGVFHVLSCSNLVPVKRVGLIFEALNGIDEIKMQWTHVGEGPEEQKIRVLIDNISNLNLTVSLKKKYSTLQSWHEYYIENSVDVFINLSSAEGLPATILEAMAYGVPVIATDVGGTSEALTPAYSFLLPADPSLEHIRLAIRHIANLSKSEQNKMRQAAIEAYHCNFDANLIRPKFYAYLRNEFELKDKI